MTYRHDRQFKGYNERLTWKKVIVYGLTLGIVLGALAYLTLWILGNQLEAQNYADQTEKYYREKAENKAAGY